MVDTGFDGRPVEAVTNKGRDDGTVIVLKEDGKFKARKGVVSGVTDLHLSRVASIHIHVISNVGSVTVAPVGKVEGDEALEANLLGSLVGIGQLFRGVAVNVGVVQGKGINANLLSIGHIPLPVIDLIVLDDTNHEMGKDIFRSVALGDFGTGSRHSQDLRGMAQSPEESTPLQHCEGDGLCIGQSSGDIKFFKANYREPGVGYFESFDD